MKEIEMTQTHSHGAQKALYLHDYVVTHVDYAEEDVDAGIEVPDNYTAYGMLVLQGERICCHCGQRPPTREGPAAM